MVDLELMSKIVNQLLGTANSPSEAIEALALDLSEEDVEEILADANVEACRGCGWWFEAGELTPDTDTEGDDDELYGLCEDCRKERIETE